MDPNIADGRHARCTHRDGPSRRPRAAPAGHPLTASHIHWLLGERLRINCSLVSGHILVVEDDEAVAVGLSRLLRSAGYACMRAANAQQAIEHLTRDIPRLIISDFNLPDMDGVSLVRRLRADARTRGVPFIMYTASCEPDFVDFFREAGATAWCSKSKPEELLRLIAQTS